MKALLATPLVFGLSLMVGLAFMPLQNADAHHNTFHKSKYLVGTCSNYSSCPVYVDSNYNRYCESNELRFYVSHAQASSYLSKGVLAVC